MSVPGFLIRKSKWKVPSTDRWKPHVVRPLSPLGALFTSVSAAGAAQQGIHHPEDPWRGHMAASCPSHRRTKEERFSAGSHTHWEGRAGGKCEGRREPGLQWPWDCGTEEPEGRAKDQLTPLGFSRADLGLFQCLSGTGQQGKALSRTGSKYVLTIQGAHLPSRISPFQGRGSQIKMSEVLQEW